MNEELTIDDLKRDRHTLEESISNQVHWFMKRHPKYLVTDFNVSITCDSKSDKLDIVSCVTIKLKQNGK